jgi:hypothetical protein
MQRASKEESREEKSKRDGEGDNIYLHVFVLPLGYYYYNNELCRFFKLYICKKLGKLLSRFLTLLTL